MVSPAAKGSFKTIKSDLNGGKKYIAVAVEAGVGAVGDTDIVNSVGDTIETMSNLPLYSSSLAP